MMRLFFSIFLVFVLALVCLPISTFSLPPLRLVEKDKVYEINNSNFTVFQDTNNLSFAHIIELQDKFIDSPSKFFRNHRSDASNWFKLKIKNESEVINEWLLVSYNYGIKEIDVYVIDKNQNVTLQPHEEKTSLNERLIFHKQPTFYLDVRKGEEITVLIRTIHASKSDYTFAIYSNYHFSSYFFTEYFWFGAFYGILGFVTILGIICYFVLNDKILLFFIFLVASQAFYMLFRDGNGLLFVIPNNPELVEIMKNISRLLFTSSLIFYCISYLEIEKDTLLFRIAILLVSLRVLFLMLSFYYPESIFKPFEFLIVSLCFGVSFYFYRSDKSDTKFLLFVSNFALWLCFLPYFLNLIGWIDQKPIYFFSLYFGILFELVLYFLGLGIQIKKLKEKY